jgi:hypothetical protein
VANALNTLNAFLNPAGAMVCGWVAWRVRKQNREGATLLAFFAIANALVFAARYIH